MRTTLRIDADVLRAVRGLARAEGKTLGAVLSELARKGLHPPGRRRGRTGRPAFDVSDDAPVLTPAMVRKALSGAR